MTKATGQRLACYRLESLEFPLTAHDSRVLLGKLGGIDRVRLKADFIENGGNRLGSVASNSIRMHLTRMRLNELDCLLLKVCNGS